MSNKKYSKILLVEGGDDKHVILALCNKFELAQTFTIKDCGGIDSLFEQIPVRFKQTNIDTVGVIIDADVRISTRWNQMQRILSKSFSDLPEDLPTEGLIYSENEKKVGVWIMPDNSTSGMLENFIRFLVPDNDLLLPQVKDLLDEIERNRQNKYRVIHRAKAEVHSWLALQEDPGTPLGLSITKRYLTVEKEECKRFVDWMRELFKVEGV